MIVMSYRSSQDRVCHWTILSAGFIDELSAEQLNLVHKGLTMSMKGLGNTLFHEDTDPNCKMG